MQCLKLVPYFLLVLTIAGTNFSAEVPINESPFWVKDLGTVGYPNSPSKRPPTKLAFADHEHLVVTFITSDMGTPSEPQGKRDPSKLRLHVIILEVQSGQIATRRDWPTPNPNDGVIGGHDGKFVVRDGGNLTMYDTTFKVLKETDTARNGSLFGVFTSASANSLLLEFNPGIHAQFHWMNANTLETVRSFSDNLYPQTISDTEVVGWRIPASSPAELVIRTPDGIGRVINPPDSRSGPVAFLNEGTLGIQSGSSPIQLVRTNGTLAELITPHTHEYFSRITSCAEGTRFAFTGSRIRNTLEILGPHQTWEYVRQVHVYDLSTHTFIAHLKVSHSGRNEDFSLALSTNGSTLAFVDGKGLKLYRLPPPAERSP
jgi:hypothetical protein